MFCNDFFRILIVVNNGILKTNPMPKALAFSFKKQPQTGTKLITCHLHTIPRKTVRTNIFLNTFHTNVILTANQ